MEIVRRAARIGFIGIYDVPPSAFRRFLARDDARMYRAARCDTRNELIIAKRASKRAEGGGDAWHCGRVSGEGEIKGDRGGATIESGEERTDDICAGEWKPDEIHAR